MIRRVVADDAVYIETWLKKRHMDFDVTNLPELGYIFPNVGAFFLRRCEGSVGILDSLVTNPDACPVVRHYALDKLYTKLINEANNLGIKRLLGFTLVAETLKRSQRHGFTVTPYTTLVRIQE